MSLDIRAEETIRDASFSSYLNANEETFIAELAESSRNMKPVILNFHEDLQCSAMPRINAPEDGEIAVFGAEKYFNGEMDENSDDNPKLVTRLSSSPRNSQMNDERVVSNPSRSETRAAGTPSVRSESSWNSQIGLLKKVPPKKHTNNKCKVFLANLGCKCSCSDNNSVDVDERGAENIQKVTSPLPTLYQPKATPTCLHVASSSNKSNEGNHFAFPTLNFDAKTMFQGHGDEKEEERSQRKSLEVFGPAVRETRSKSLGMERKLAILSWDSNPRMEVEDFNGADSDASSDLFEIESLTGISKALLAAQETEDPMGSITPSNGYAPSEASIEWSVVTASAAEFSIASDYEDLRSCTTTTNPTRKSSRRMSSGSKAKTRRSTGLLSGCKSQKAVMVSGDAYRSREGYRHVPSSTKLAGFESRKRIASSGPSVSLSPPRALYIR